MASGVEVDHHKTVAGKAAGNRHAGDLLHDTARCQALGAIQRPHHDGAGTIGRRTQRNGRTPTGEGGSVARVGDGPTDIDGLAGIRDGGCQDGGGNEVGLPNEDRAGARGAVVQLVGLRQRSPGVGNHDDPKGPGKISGDDECGRIEDRGTCRQCATGRAGCIVEERPQQSGSFETGARREVHVVAP